MANIGVESSVRHFEDPKDEIARQHSVLFGLGSNNQELGVPDRPEGYDYGMPTIVSKSHSIIKSHDLGIKNHTTFLETTEGMGQLSAEPHVAWLRIGEPGESPRANEGFAHAIDVLSLRLARPEVVSGGAHLLAPGSVAPDGSVTYVSEARVGTTPPDRLPEA